MEIVLFSSPPGVYDTSKAYGKELISYGTVFNTTNFKVNGEVLKFPGNKLERTAKIDERNLSLCKWLNLDESSIQILDGANFKCLEYLSADNS